MADSKNSPSETPVTPSSKNKSTNSSPAIQNTPLSNKAASYQRPDHYAPGTQTSTLKVDQLNLHLREDCNPSRLVSFEEFAIKVLRLPEDWKNTWTEQLERALKLPDWTTYKEAWYRESHENALYHPFSQLCNKAIAAMTGGQDDMSSLVMYEQYKSYQMGYSKRSPDAAATLWRWAQKAGGKLDKEKAFEGLDKKGIKKISWEQIRMFLEVKNTPNGKTLGGQGVVSPNFVKRPPKAESSQTGPGVASSSGSRKRGLVDQTSARGSQKRQKNSKSTRTSTGSRMTPASETQISGDPPTDNNNPVHVSLQCAGYALEMLTSGRVRSHAIGMLVDGPNVQLQYYDRSVILKTHGISIFDENERQLFAAALYCLTRLTPAQWGIILNDDEEDVGMSAEEEEKSRNDPLAGMEFRLDKGGMQKRMRLVRLIFRSHGIIGRGTIVAEAVCTSSGCESDWKGPLVVKISFPASSRVMEYELISEALTKATDEHAWVRNHLPHILWSQDIPFGENTPQGQLAKLFPDHYERRHACITVQQKLQPIHDLVTPGQFAQVFFDVLQCHRWLYKISKILHRDISLSNMMFWRDSTTNEVYGVLNDFDLSSRVTENSRPSSNQRTGTKPYMALDLFDPDWEYGHFYRHDLESIFYVLLCLCSRYKGPREHVDASVKPPPFESWFTGTYQQVSQSKNEFIYRPKSRKSQNSNIPEITGVITGFFRKFESWAVGIYLCIRRGYVEEEAALVSHIKFDHQTLGDQFTYTRVAAIMSHFDGVQLKKRTTVSLDDD